MSIMVIVPSVCIPHPAYFLLVFLLLESKRKRERDDPFVPYSCKGMERRKDFLFVHLQSTLRIRKNAKEYGYVSNKGLVQRERWPLCKLNLHDATHSKEEETFLHIT